MSMFLVAGATGTMGRPLVDVLVSEDVKVRAVVHDPATGALGQQLLARPSLSLTTRPAIR
jgi:uncharacterized protein YbjT (DUF2867 family)